MPNSSEFIIHTYFVVQFRVECAGVSKIPLLEHVVGGSRLPQMSRSDSSTSLVVAFASVMGTSDVRPVEGNILGPSRRRLALELELELKLLQNKLTIFFFMLDIVNTISTQGKLQRG